MVANDIATSPSISTTSLAHPKALNVGPIGLLADVALGYSPRKFDNQLPPISHLTGEVRAPAPRRAPRRLSPTGWKDGDAQSQMSMRFLQLPPPGPDPTHSRGHHPSHPVHVQHRNQSQPQPTQYWSERRAWPQSDSSDTDSSEDEDEWTPAPKRRPQVRTRSSARLAVKRERDSSELRDLERSGSVSPTEGKPKKRTYVRRDAQRRKEQNAQAQKKFRWKKKVLQEQMRADLEEQRALVEELQQKCAAFEDIQFALAEAQADNARLAARLEACARKVESV
ncbi:hypothetical protein CcaverHIS002_0602930 [Cutaneotrichosporon cavernicola]|uniref:BZIP domain-containing protein n=1 Tax=Cutaneotrichosporon cavernicola TaxID=279322 RepID=A0AA48QXV5_9TREE|nr:uncharacterized protein CcaverHIS019_0602410 [Cutaneotrichosporon cavernicola]BEI86006.1 hypothetical protein CcaverHIS002_0602930 [Cutaneotrichosporon cavernicola]BEI93782.1 hypothetical protein CcaverHIS019_0602410 [Cutaneotrichosporon cavernicola]